MKNTNEIINYTSNSKTPSSDRPWKYYQEWHKVLLLHWKVPVSVLENILPKGLKLDTYNGNAWISLLPFTVKKHRFNGFPAIPLISSFHEIHLRTYVMDGSTPGIYIFSIETDKLFTALISRLTKGMPYTKSGIERTSNRYISENTDKNYGLDLSYIVKDNLEKSGIDNWLTERHALYVSRNNRPYRFDIDHKEWELKEVQLNYKYIYYPIENFLWPRCSPDKIHYCKKIDVAIRPHSQTN